MANQCDKTTPLAGIIYGIRLKNPSALNFSMLMLDAQSFHLPLNKLQRKQAEDDNRY